jgi:probable phosphoglycerate mutase
MRASETAELLGLLAVPEPLLAEMDWGEWEGRTLHELRAADPVAMKANEARGLDFRPPGGESPRDVQARLIDWADALTEQGPGPFGAVTHKGIIRAAIALALGWDMLPPDPVKLQWSAAHILRFTRERTFQVVELNVPLEGVGAR